MSEKVLVYNPGKEITFPYAGGWVVLSSRSDTVVDSQAASLLLRQHTKDGVVVLHDAAAAAPLAPGEEPRRKALHEHELPEGITHDDIRANADRIWAEVSGEELPEPKAKPKGKPAAGEKKAGAEGKE